MFHTAAYFVSISTTANTKVPAITDNILTISNQNLLPTSDWDLIWAAAMSATLNRARIVSPSNRQVTLPFIRPIIAAATPPDDPAVADYSEFPFRIRGLEELEMQATSDIAMGNEDCYIVIGLRKQFTPVPAGNVFTMRGTSTTTSVAATWTTLTTTWADTLPEGTYAVVGLNVVGATQVAARIIFEDQIERPGALATAAVGNRTGRIFRKGKLGSWGNFRAVAMPQIQVLNTAAVAVFTVYMDFVRIA